MKLDISYPEQHTYQPGSNKNYGTNAMKITFGPMDVWFSYQTPVAFHFDGRDRVVLRNYWSKTTGTHLNAIDSRKELRVDQETFDQMWKEQVAEAFAPQNDSEKYRAALESIVEQLAHE